MPEEKSKMHGFYRAKVIDNVDSKKFGRVKVWIPDIMPKVSDDKGLWAMPANNPVGGLNSDGNAEHFYSGTSYVPPKGSYVWVFFENANPNRPYYFGALDLQNTMVLPEAQTGEHQKKWVIFKSHEGRCIVISDDPSDCRVEITGKKRQLSNPPVGDTTSVYSIDGNQTTILLDERSGSEKILIRTHKGDYINIDTENQKLSAYFSSDYNLKSNATISIKTASDVNIKCGGNVNIQAGADLNLKAGGNVNIQSGGDINELAGGNINLDGSTINENAGASSPATDATDATPTGTRD